MDWRQTSLALFIGAAGLVATVFFMLLAAASKGTLPEPGQTMALVIIGGGVLLLAVWFSTR